MTQREIEHQAELTRQLRELGFPVPGNALTVYYDTLMELVQPTRLDVIEAHALGVDLTI